MGGYIYKQCMSLHVIQWIVSAPKRPVAASIEPMLPPEVTIGRRNYIYIYIS